MAKRNNSITFKNAQLDLEQGIITEFKKEETETHRLLDWLREFEGENRFVDLTIKEVTEIEAEE